MRIGVDPAVEVAPAWRRVEGVAREGDLAGPLVVAAVD